MGELVLALVRVFLEIGQLEGPAVSDRNEVLFAQRYAVELPDGTSGDAVQMTVQPRFETDVDGARFAFLLATPSPPQVESAPQDVFEGLAALTAMREEIDTIIIEDPDLGTECYEPEYAGCGGGYVSRGDRWQPPPFEDDGWDDIDAGSPAPWLVGAYEVVTLAATNVSTFAYELERLDYSYQSQDLLALEPYLAEGWTLVAVRVAVEGAQDASLAPLSFVWPGNAMRLPVGVARAMTTTMAHYTVYAYARERRDLGGAHIGYAQQVAEVGTAWLTRNELDVDLAIPLPDPEVTASPAGDTAFREVNVTIVEERVPVEVDCHDDDADADLGCCYCRTGRRGYSREANGLLIVLATGWALRRRPRRR